MTWSASWGLDSEDRRSLQQYLDELDAQQIIHRIRRGRYALPSRESVVSGVLMGHRDGYGFVTPDPGSPFSEDIFIPPHGIEDAMQDDRVMVRVSRKKRIARLGRRGKALRGETR